MWLKYGFFLGLLTLPAFCSSQSQCFPCLKLHISGAKDSVDSKVIYPANLGQATDKGRIEFNDHWYYRLFYTIENCGSKDFSIDTTEIPNYENNDYRRINFQFYYADKYGRFLAYPAEPGDVQELIDFTKDPSKNLKPHEKYTYSFDLFGLYVIRQPGIYRIYASYRLPLGEHQGYYLQQSENYIELQIE